MRVEGGAQLGSALASLQDCILLSNMPVTTASRGMVAWEAFEASRWGPQRVYRKVSYPQPQSPAPGVWGGCKFLLSQQGAATDEDRYLNNSGDLNTWEEQPQKRAYFLLIWDVEVQSGDLNIKVKWYLILQSQAGGPRALQLNLECQ